VKGLESILFADENASANIDDLYCENMDKKILSEEDIDFNQIKNMIVFLIAEIGGEKGLSKKGIHKTCFAIKSNLGEKFELNNMLPFYWYYYGPYSQVINDCIEMAMNDGLIEEQIVEERYKRYIVSDLNKYNPPTNLDITKIGSVINGLNIQWYNIENLTDFIYRNYSPRIFRYHFYKTKLSIGNCSDKVPNIVFRQEHIYNVYRNQIREWMYKSEGNLPRDDFFSIYRIIFSRYITFLQRIFNKKLKFNTEMIGHLNDVTKITEDAWETFGEGERILEHDDYVPYHISLPIWKKKYISHLESWEKSLNAFEEHIISVIGLENLKTNYTTREKEFLKTVLR